MAEAAGLVIGVIGLLPVCVKGFTFIENVIKNDRRVEEQVVRMQIQRWDLDAWGRVWEIPKSVEQHKLDFKLRRWARINRDAAASILGTLAAISNLFADAATLQKKYGIKMKQKDAKLKEVTRLVPADFHTDINVIQKRVEARKDHMSIMRRCLFELKGVPEFGNLVERLREYIASLRNICSELQAAQIDREIPQTLFGNQNPDTLRTVSAVYNAEADLAQQAGQEASGRRLVGNLAAFKGRSIRLVKKREREVEDRKRRGLRSEAFLFDGQFLQVEDFDVIEQAEKSFMRAEDVEGGLFLAVNKTKRKACFVEYKPYKTRDPYNGWFGDGDPSDTDMSERDVMGLSDFMHIKDRPAAFRILTFAGIFRDPANSRFGFVYEAPDHIANLEGHKTLLPSYNKALIKARTPKTLLEYLSKTGAEGAGGGKNVMPLGDRFQLARDVVQCVYALHAAGWVHKNIRSSSIAFLPSKSQIENSNIPSTTGAKDFTHPYLCGFGQSRPGKEAGREVSTAWNIKLDEHHHPAKRMNSALLYTHGFDVYSLGILLLEIALWQPLSSIISPSHSPLETRTYLQATAREELPGQVGKIYTRAVVACLEVRSTEGDEAVGEMLRWKVMNVLDECKA